LQKDRGQRAMTAKSHFLLINQTYLNVSNQYKQIQAEFPTEKVMLLRSDDEIVSELNSIASAYELMMAEFNSFKTVMSQLGKTGYSQKLEVKEIKNFVTDGGGVADFHADVVEIWDYKKWSTDAVKAIKEEVEPLRAKLVAYDIEINKLLDHVKKDSVEVRNEITDLEGRLKVNPIARIDPFPMPLQLFQMKIAELNYASDHIARKKLRDSADLFVRLDAIDKDVKNLKKVDSLAVNLEKIPMEEESLNYQHFVTNAYGTSLVLKSLVKATREFADHELARKKVAYQHALKAKDWIVIERDSVPLTMMRSVKYTHSPLVIQTDRFTTGLKYGADSVANGYFYTITRTRVPDLKVTFPVDKASFQRKNLPVIKGLGSQDDKGQVYFAVVYSETKADNKFPVTIAKIYRTDGLAWSTNYKFELAPSELIFSPDTGELSVKIASPTGESKVVIIDKNGKQQM
jgi:hypothetical protein